MSLNNQKVALQQRLVDHNLDPSGGFILYNGGTTINIYVSLNG